ncbi:xylulokinase [Symbiobacterium terraclitae]|uniref:Xylulose kinase n=1 Tax=Symbiobacterium terraclitae TaxID=557451 RepID=A0ABS4JXD4_9FIRM|nr:xylulokinase [Symbiobacterium terraclitae]MBP2020197.1 xylulokinase [Symbiobacterium terraclitae]
MQEIYIGIDIGTGGARVLAVDRAGRVVAQATQEYPLLTPRPGWTEQDPADWWAATAACLRRVTAEVGPGRVRGVGLTGQMHGSVFLDDRGQVVRPALLWNDQRTQAQCDEITVRVGTDRLLALAGNRALTGFTAPKLLWLRQHEPDAYARVRHLLLPKDYLRYRLTGEFATDVADASGTLLLDVAARRWSEPILEALEIDPAILPRLAEGPEVTGFVTPPAAAETGLPAGTPVVGGGGDQAANAVGVGLVTEGAASLALGTSGVVFAASGQPGHVRNGAGPGEAVAPPGLPEDSLSTIHSFCHAVPGMWHVMGVMLSSGGSLRWLRDALYAREAAEDRQAGREPYDRVTGEAATVPAGAEGLLFLPYLTGERVPYPDPSARGAFVGLGLQHTRAHVARAVMEGIAFGLRDNLDLVRALGVGVAELRITGGGSRSPLWRTILAAALGVPLRRMAVDEGPAFGAAILAAAGTGAYPDVASACAAMIRTGDAVPVDPDLAARYAELLPVFRQCYAQLKTVFPQLAS